MSLMNSYFTLSKTLEGQKITQFTAFTNISQPKRI